MWLEGYGRNSGLAVDPIEKKPLYHFFPSSRVLSFGTAGCNLRCRYCQNWSLSASRRVETVSISASPEMIADSALRAGVRSVAFTYNEPVIFLEYAVDTAMACHDLGIMTVAVTAAEILPGPREEFFGVIDAVNVDLKSFREGFYERLCGAPLAPVLDNLEYLVQETGLWLEITTLLIPGENDSEEEIDEMTVWIMEHLGPDIPMHFSAFRPAYKMLNHQPTPLETLLRAREIALDNGLRYVYTGNVPHLESSTTFCSNCGEILIERHGYRSWIRALDTAGNCSRCAMPCPGRF